MSFWESVLWVVVLCGVYRAGFWHARLLNARGISSKALWNDMDRFAQTWLPPQ